MKYGINKICCKKGSDRMEKFKYEIPTLKRKEDAINYIKEHIEVASDINGSGGLDRYINDYEGWLEKLELDYLNQHLILLFLFHIPCKFLMLNTN